MVTNQHIGIFDSGIGGLSVLKALKSELPYESYIYFGDSANAPYGQLGNEEIVDLSLKNTRFLLDRGAKLVVVACNTATGAAIETLRSTFQIPFVGMEPAVKPAASQSVSGKIGVLATARTFEADHYNNTVERFANGVEVIIKVGSGLVELVESGEINSEKTHSLLLEYLSPMLDAGIDQLVLGCTHYPFLIPVIRKIIPETIAIHDPAPAVARHTRNILERGGIANEPGQKRADEFYSSGNVNFLRKMAESILEY